MSFELLRWVALTLVLAGTFLLVALWRFPSAVTKIYVRRFGKRLGTPPWNQLQGGALLHPGTDHVVRSSPDILNMFGVYDVSAEPARVRCFVPDWDAYWSISLYAWNTENFYVLNDRMTKPGALELIIVGPGGHHQKKGNETVVMAPTARGVIVLRAVVKNREDTEEVARMQELVQRSTITRYSETGEDPSNPRAAG